MENERQYDGNFFPENNYYQDNNIYIGDNSYIDSNNQVNSNYTDHIDHINLNYNDDPVTIQKNRFDSRTNLVDDNGPQINNRVSGFGMSYLGHMDEQLNTNIYGGNINSNLVSGYDYMRTNNNQIESFGYTVKSEGDMAVHYIDNLTSDIDSNIYNENDQNPINSSLFIDNNNNQINSDQCSENTKNHCDSQSCGDNTMYSNQQSKNTVYFVELARLLINDVLNHKISEKFSLLHFFTDDVPGKINRKIISSLVTIGLLLHKYDYIYELAGNKGIKDKIQYVLYTLKLKGHTYIQLYAENGDLYRYPTNILSPNLLENDYYPLITLLMLFYIIQVPNLEFSIASCVSYVKTSFTYFKKLSMDFLNKKIHSVLFILLECDVIKECDSVYSFNNSLFTNLKIRTKSDCTVYCWSENYVYEATQNDQMNYNDAYMTSVSISSTPISPSSYTFESIHSPQIGSPNYYFMQDSSTYGFENIFDPDDSISPRNFSFDNDPFGPLDF